MVMRIAMTLDIAPDDLAPYMEAHKQVPEEVQHALTSVGIRNLSLWVWNESRMFYYAEYVGSEPFEDAMARYAKMPGVKEWEQRMHKYQKKLPGTPEDSDVWWQPMINIVHQD
ncbi:UPF0734 protein [Porphyridium purpureum]|uniref:UPF0734 protein n=1 Tax=Porphyridium purpureum TaxID=35688 RepID=A0A5J4YKM5_PORPP|nr:UPF0734 protein [Porphyridium purpureum]|eukprot:POR0272..scf291_13